MSHNLKLKIKSNLSETKKPNGLDKKTLAIHLIKKRSSEKSKEKPNPYDD